MLPVIIKGTLEREACVGAGLLGHIFSCDTPSSLASSGGCEQLTKN